ncbi:DUF6438 domain-containing protein [Polaribacter sp.]|uniref:DUF6438 domain-containing protein n=1 Tax=Polaribacter sp. TaxID=1920175 RepID=UPI003EF9E915
MRILLCFFFFLMFSCNTKTQKKEEILPPDNSELKDVEVVKKTAYQEVIVVLKNANNLENAKAFISSKNLNWEELVINTQSLKAVLLKVPLEKRYYWIDTLNASGLFYSIDFNDKKTIKQLKKEIENTFVKLIKTPCNGDCPVYDVLFLNDGKVLFNGIANVLFEGKKELTLTEKELEKIKYLFKQTIFKDYKTSYLDKTIKGLPGVIITHKNKQVEINLWKNVPIRLAIAHESLEDVLLKNNLIE